MLDCMKKFASFIILTSLALPLQIADALTFKSGETKNFSSNKSGSASKGHDSTNGSCQHSLSMPERLTPVEFDISGFLHKEAFDLPDYASFSFGRIHKESTDGSPSPEIKAVADLNNDGRDDLIIDYYETLVPPLVLLANSDGTFSAAKVDPKAARRHIRNGSVADFNNDGLLDFAGFTTGDPGKRWKAQGYSTEGRHIPRGEADLLLINTGKGFVNHPIPELRRNDWNHGGDVGDLDGDGLIDILPLSEGEKERTVPLRNISGHEFVLGDSEYSSEVSYYLTPDLDVGDFNNDGILDIAVAMTPNRERTPETMSKLGAVRVIYGDGDFNFDDNKKISFGESWVTASDMEEWKSKASNSSQAGSNHKAGRFMNGTSHIEAVDLNGDGKDDLLLGHWVSTTGLWQTAGFTAYLSMEDCFAEATNELFPNQKTNRLLSEDIAVNYSHNFYLEDLNSDGLKDLIIQSDGRSEEWFHSDPNAGHPYLFLNQDGFWLPIRGRDVNPWISVDDIVPGDFNGDGLTDLAYVKRDKSNVALHVSLAEMSLEAARTNFDWSKDKFAGSYVVEWAIENVNSPGDWEMGARDVIRLHQGQGKFGKTTTGIPGNAEQREALKIVYGGASGEIEISGPLGLFEAERTYNTKFIGNLKDGELNTIWQEGDRIKIRLQKLEN